MIPEGWTSTKIGAVSEVVTSGSRGWASFYSNDGDHFIRITNLRRSNIQIDYSNLRFVQLPKDGNEGKRTKLRKGDILISITADLGTIGYIEDEPIRDSYINQHIALVRLNKNKIISKFVAYQLATKKHHVLFQRMNDSGAKAGLNLPSIRSVPILIPPLAEQKRIAEILSTWDQAIETTEKLIANAEAQKKALMQQLLTGKKRLPGFSGEWKKTTLIHVAQILVSNVDKKSTPSESNVRLCNYMDVYKNNRISKKLNFMKATASSQQIEKFALKTNDVLITKDSERPDDIAISSYVTSTAPDIVCGYHIAIIRPKECVCGHFLKFYFDASLTKYYFQSRANGATRFGLTVPAIQKAPIKIPVLEEQHKIALILSDYEDLILKLNQKIFHLKQEKAALMQQLLTGKRRVKIEEPRT